MKKFVSVAKTRCSEPQLFFGAKAKLDLNEIRQRMRDAEESWEFLPEDQLPADSPLWNWMKAPDRIKRDVKAVEECFTYEGWAALRVMSAYLRNEMIF